MGEENMENDFAIGYSQSNINNKTGIVDTNEMSKEQQRTPLANLNAFDVATSKNDDIPIGVGELFDKSNYAKHADEDYLDNLSRVTFDTDLDQEITNLQTNASRIGHALLNNLVITGTTALDGIVGTGVGIATALAEGRISGLYDNAVTRKLNDWRTAATEYNFITRSKDYEDMGVFERMNLFKGGIVFWADAVQNLGYTQGMLLGSAMPYGATGALMNLAGKGAKLAKAAGHKTLEVLSGKVVPAILAAEGEAATEAIGNYEDKVKLKKQKALDEYRKKIQASPGLKLHFDKELGKAYSDIIDDEITQSNFVMAGNMVIVPISNMIGSYQSLFLRGYDTGRRAALNIAWDKAKKLGKGEIGFSDVVKLQNKPWAYAKATGKGILEAIPEGLEEGAQDLLTYFPEHIDAWNRFYHNELNPDQTKKCEEYANTIDEIKNALIQTYADALGDSNFSTDVMSGIITGLTGAPTIARNKRGKYRPTWGGGIWEQYSEEREKFRKGEEFIEQMKSRFDENKWKPFYTNVMRQMEINDRKMDALLRGDKKAYEDADVDGLLSDFIAFDEAGQGKLYKELISSALDFTDPNPQSPIPILILKKK